VFRLFHVPDQSCSALDASGCDNAHDYDEEAFCEGICDPSDIADKDACCPGGKS